MRQLLLFFMVVLFFSITKKSISQVLPKSYWEKYTTADGLVGNNIQDVLIEGNADVWIATSNGLSHFDGVTFTNYTLANSNMLDVNVLELELAQNKLWLRTTSGISSFDGVTFTNYTTANGLLSNDIRGITSTSTDTLWMVSLSGASKFDGTNFTHYPLKTGRDIEADSADHIYILRYSVANNFTFAHLYDNGTWSTPSPTGGVVFQNSINPAQFKKTVNNELFIVGTGAFHVKVNYPLNLERQNIIVDNRIAGNGLVDLTVFEQSNGINWIGAGSNTSPFLMVSRDSVYERQYITNSKAKATCIDVTQGLLVVGSDTGVYISLPTIKKRQSNFSLSVNEITTSVRITDPLFSNIEENRANFEFPKNSGNHGIYSANFIVVAKKSNQINYEVHPQNGYSTVFVPGPINTVGGLNGSYIVKVSRQDVANHQLNYNQPNYTLPSGIEDWPAYGDTTLGIAKDLAPFVDFNANGCYDPKNGDYPIIKGDEAIYWINHPDDNNFELEYHWMMYAYDSRSDTFLNQSLFVQYTIINRATVAYDSIDVGLYVDGDLGNPSDDYVGTDSVNDILYFYNGTPFDFGSGSAPGYGNNTPALGVKFLSDKLTNSIYYTNGAGVTGDPQNSGHWRGYLESKWKNGQQLRYGGNGYNSSAVTMNTTTHMFTGNPYLQTGWTEVTPGGTEPANAPGDRRIVGSIAPFSLQPNERRTIEIAVGYGRAPNANSIIGENISEMVSVLNDVNTYWNLIPLPGPNYARTDSCNTITSVDKNGLSTENSFEVYPIPTTNNITIESEETIVEVQLIDMKGSFVESLQPNQKKFQIELERLREGFYMIRARDSKNKWESKKIMLMK